MVRLSPGDSWLKLFAHDFKNKQLDDPERKNRRLKLLRASLLGLPNAGHLFYHGRFRLGLEWLDYWKCSNCGCTFPVIDGHIRCNGENITICPWCRVDSTPGRFGA